MTSPWPVPSDLDRFSREPRRRWWPRYVTGSLMVALGVLVPCGGIITMGIITVSAGGPSVQPPGQVAVEVDSPGLMVIWIDEPDTASPLDTVPAVPPDMTATVTDPTGQRVQTLPPSGDLVMTTFEGDRRGAYVFNATSPGTYTVHVTGTFTQTQTVAVTSDPTSRETTMGIVALLLMGGGFVLLVGGFVLLIVTGVQHSAESKRAREAAWAHGRV